LAQKTKRFSFPGQAGLFNYVFQFLSSTFSLAPFSSLVKPKLNAMKRSLLLLICFALSLSIYAQINVGKKIKEKVKERADQKTDEAIDKTLDSAEEAAKKKDRTVKDTIVPKATESPDKSSTSTSNFASYSKFDFVPGEQVTFFDDFSQDAVGDFPANWNTDGSGEIVTLSGLPGRWLKLMLGNSYGPLLKNNFPDNYTLEYDMIVRLQDGKEDPDFTLILFSSGNKNFDKGQMPGDAGVYADFWRECVVHNWNSGENSEIGQANSFKTAPLYGKKTHFSFWVQKQRVRIYVNETKIIDLPRAVPANINLNKINFNFSSELDPSIVGGEIYLTNVRIAVGAPDMRNKLLTDGKMVTHGILFDVNSDKIKPESYGTLKEIAQLLKDNPALKVKIIGHTDSDGADAANLDLSKKRSAAVKASLSKDFGVDISRMETDGKGEAEPVSKNDTQEGKANNRRVEFIKI
jgi:OmpA-OmpF porin, OOP family